MRRASSLVAIALLLGAALAPTTLLGRYLLDQATVPPGLVDGGPPEFLMGLQGWLGKMLQMLKPALTALVLTAFLVLLRILLRKDWLTFLVPTLFMVSVLTLATGELSNAPGFALIWAPLFFMVVRFGLLALAAGGFFSSTGLLIQVWDPSSWYFPYVLAGLIVYLAPMFYAFFVSLGGRKLFRAELLDG